MKFFFIFLFSIIFLIGKSQIIFKGVVLDEVTKKPISNINIFDKENSIGTFTNEDGEFLLVLKYKTSIYFSGVGYKKFSIDVESDTVLNIFMYNKVIQENIVTIKPNIFLNEYDAGSLKANRKKNVTPFNKKSIFFTTIVLDDNIPKKQLVKISVKLSTTNQREKNHLVKVYLFSLDDSLNIKENLITNDECFFQLSNKKSEIFEIDLEKLNVFFKEPRILIGIEKLDNSIIESFNKQSLLQIKKRESKIPANINKYIDQLKIQYFRKYELQVLIKIKNYQ